MYVYDVSYGKSRLSGHVPKHLCVLHTMSVCPVFLSYTLKIIF